MAAGRGRQINNCEIIFYLVSYLFYDDLTFSFVLEDICSVDKTAYFSFFTMIF
jgi:hypothetical protein